jgi:hypothetical protein
MQVHTLLQVGQFVSEFTLGSCGMRQTVLNILIHTKVRNKVVSWWLGWFSESSTCPLTKLVLSALSMSKTILNIVVSAKVRNWVTILRIVLLILRALRTSLVSGQVLLSLNQPSHQETTLFLTLVWIRILRTVCRIPQLPRVNSDTNCPTCNKVWTCIWSQTQSVPQPGAPSTNTKRSHSVTRLTTQFQTLELIRTSWTTTPHSHSPRA